MIIATLSLWSPHGSFSVGAAVLLAFVLGMIHGVTPDEHTWPITFSYSIGSYSSRKGLVSGLTFSLAFTLQRAIASELAYFSLTRILTDLPWLNFAIYVVVGLAMGLASLYLFRGNHWHLLSPSHHLKEITEEDKLSDSKTWMPALRSIRNENGSLPLQTHRVHEGEREESKRVLPLADPPSSPLSSKP